MDCPVCTDVTLAVSSREGVEIDYCPQCRGVWLDRGELDKIIDRVVGPRAPAAVTPDRPGPEPRRDPRYDERIESPRRDRYDDRDDRPRRRKRGSFLEDLFDFD
ncbi:MAG: zf-TFIIB domain-containing protein [Acidimicrobiia bacterium]|jgi:uncharacterized protein